MNESDIEFTVGFDTSPALQKLDELEEHMPMADAALQRMTGTFVPSQNNPPNIGPTGANYPRSGAMADSFFEKSVAANLEKEIEKVTNANNSAFSKIKDSLFSGVNTAKEKFEKASGGGVPPGNNDDDARKTDEIKQDEEAITDEAKAQNREMNEHHIKLGKTLTILGLIKTAVESIKKLWGAAFNMQANLNAEAGLLTADAIGTFSANTDKSYSMFHRGQKAMGTASPFKGGEVEEAMERLSAAKKQAMSGQKVDEKLSTAVSELSRRFGTGLNVVQLLTGDPSRSMFDIVKQMSEAVEKGLPDLAGMSEKERSRYLQYMEDVFGKGFVNALATNYNINQRTPGDQKYAIERVMSHGESAVTSLNTAEATRSITESAAELKEAMDSLSQTILGKMAPALTQFLNLITGWLKQINGLISIFNGDKKERPVSKFLHNRGLPVPWTLEPLLGSKNADVWSVAGAIDKAVSPDYKDVAQALKENPDYLKKANEAMARHASVEDVINAAIQMNPAYGSQFGGNYLEGMKARSLKYRWFDELKTGGLEGTALLATPEGEIAKAILGATKGKNIESFDDFEKATRGLDFFMEGFFKDGGKYDVTASQYMEPLQYLLSGMSQRQQREYIKLLARELNLGNTGGAISGSEIKINTEGKAELTINFTDVFGSAVTKKFEVPLESASTNAIIDERVKRYINATTTSTPSGGR